MMRAKDKRNIDFRWLGIPLVTLLAACGGGSSDNNPPANTGGASNTLSGSVFASAVNGASCEVKDRFGDLIAGPFTTSSVGAYHIILPEGRLAEDAAVECSGGTFTDEATGLTNRTAGAMAAYISGGIQSTGNVIHVTPTSTIIHRLITSHEKTAQEAVAVFEAEFGFSPNYAIAPTDVTAPLSGSEKNNLLIGLRAATFSQLAKDLELLSTDQFTLFDALAADLADGKLDGQDDSGVIFIEGTSVALPVDIQNRFNRALVNFRMGGRDASGLENNDFGALPFAKVAMTDNYKITYLPSMHDAINGKTQFTLNVTDHSNTPLTGLSVSIKPKMNMSGMVHGAAFDSVCAERAENGEYDCTVYYLMPSIMMNGMSMGFWELKVMVGGYSGERTFFYPTVEMAMGDTAQVRLKGLDDKISSSMNHDHAGNGAHSEHRMGSMTGEVEARTYYLFKRGLTGMTDNHRFEFFIAAKENMMHYPAVFSGAVLNSGDMQHELSIVTMSVEVSNDAINWVSATENGAGVWVANGIAGLTDDHEGTLYVRLIVEGEQKTTDGMPLNSLTVTDDGNNHYAKFRVTPGGSNMQM